MSNETSGNFDTKGPGIEAALEAWGRHISEEYRPAFPLGNERDARLIAQSATRAEVSIAQLTEVEDVVDSSTSPEQDKKQ